MAPQPFFVFALPRSRTFWLSKWLGQGSAPVGHDLGALVDSCQQFHLATAGVVGTVETGAMVAHRLIRQMWPEAKFVTIRRLRGEVLESLAKFGIEGQEGELEHRDACLDELENLGAQRVDYENLNDVNCCAWLMEYLRAPLPFDFNWWQAHAGLNLQVPMATRLELLANRQDAIQALIQEAAELEKSLDPQFSLVRRETWDSLWADAKNLAEGHYLEANGGEPKPGHPFEMDVELMRQIEATGRLLAMTARVNGTLVGYITWTVVPNSESKGMQIADMGGPYVSPGFSKFNFGSKLISESIKLLQMSGVKNLQLHHPAFGRGAKLGPLFERLGAKLVHYRYELQLEDSPDA